MVKSRSGNGRGSRYRKLWSATGLSTLRDGLFLTALRLLAAQLTRDPLRISLVDFAGSLPWLLFGLVSGSVPMTRITGRLGSGTIIVPIVLVAAGSLAATGRPPTR